MVGNKGKGARSKPKALKAEPAEPEPLEQSLDGSAIVASDEKNGNDDILTGTEIPTEEELEQTVELTSGFIVSDDFEENDQNALEDNDYEKDETNIGKTEDGCTQEQTIDDVINVGDGDHATTDWSVEVNGERINTDYPEDHEAPLEFDNNDVSTGDEREVTPKDVAVSSGGLDSDHGLIENMTNNLENHKKPSELEMEEPVGTTSDKKEENANITDEVKVVTGKVTTPKKKVVKKLVKKILVKKNAVNKEMPQPSTESNVTGETSKVDADKYMNIEEKASDLNDASVGECKADNNEPMCNKEEAEVKPSVTVNKKRNRNRKKKAPQGQLGIATIKDAQKPQSENATAINELELENEEVENSGDKANLKKSKTKKMAKKGTQEAVPKDVKKPKEGKSSKKVGSMGMIFMCNSETKKDCYRYNVLGLPNSKKDMVLKIYKGMRLFLFDVNLRVMYGIYKAAGPGGYNIEPSAFKSQFPSQVRFSVLADCAPLAEEKFKKVLKDNYYSKNKFNFQLNSEQVKNLCKLFQESRKKAESTRATTKPRKAVAASSSARRDDKKRKRVEDSRRAVAARPPPLEQERSRRRIHEEPRRAPVVLVNRYHERPAYERETYVPSVAPVPMYQPILETRTASNTRYPYDRVSVVDPYRRETVIDHRDLAPSSRVVSRLPIERSHYDSYVSYREAPQVYSGQTYSTGTRSEHYDYTSDRHAEYYRSADYRPPPPLYRRY